MPHSQQMTAVDVLEVPLLVNNNRYLLVVQDYYTKWADGISLPDQTAACKANYGLGLNAKNLGGQK